MQIIVNGEAETVDDNARLHDVLNARQLLEKRIAVEVNEELITRSEFSNFTLNEGDHIEIVQAIGGG